MTTSRAADSTFDLQVRQQAIAWCVRLGSGLATDEDHLACATWRGAHPQHEQAWLRLQQVRQMLTSVPGEAVLPALAAAAVSRRRLLKGIAGVAVVSGSGWLGVREQPWQPYLADMRTRVGEGRNQVLADGSTLFLNTGSAVDIAFDAESRLLRLHAGELLLASGDRPGERRPLIVRTRQGDVRPADARFSVREQDGRSLVTVFESVVDVRPVGAPASVRVQAGERVSFDRSLVGPTSLAARGADAWIRNQLVVSDWPLRDVLDELARYRPGVLRCAPKIAGIRVSGVFSLADTDRTLAILAQRFPIVISTTTRYWVSVDAAS